MTASIEIDDSDFPVIVVRYRGLAEDERFEQYLQELTRVRSRGPSVVIFDALEAGFPPARQRRRQAEWIDQNRALLQRNSLGTVFLLDSSLVRGALTAVLWLSPIPGEWTVVGTREEARQWAEARLRDRRRDDARP